MEGYSCKTNIRIVNQSIVNYIPKQYTNNQTINQSINQSFYVNCPSSQSKWTYETLHTQQTRFTILYYILRLLLGHLNIYTRMDFEILNLT